MIEAIGIAAAIVGGVSLLIGLMLGFAGKIFAVKVDEKAEAVRAALPGSNCGGCGYAGCDALAAAIAAGEAPPNACPVGGSTAAKEIAAIMGVETGAVLRQVAYVQCAGTCDKAEISANYYGTRDCRQAAMSPGNAGKACSFACYGFGTCVTVCPNDAISLVDGVAVVDEDKCISCGQCAAICPQHIITMIPDNSAVEVRCSSNNPGKETKAVCRAGCIGCGICQKVCPVAAAKVENHLSRIDHALCIGCGACAAKCPVKVIELLAKPVVAGGNELK